jgi:hypothetical protein
MLKYFTSQTGMMLNHMGSSQGSSQHTNEKSSSSKHHRESTSQMIPWVENLARQQFRVSAEIHICKEQKRLPFSRRSTQTTMDSLRCRTSKHFSTSRPPMSHSYYTKRTSTPTRGSCWSNRIRDGIRNGDTYHVLILTKHIKCSCTVIIKWFYREE